MSFLILTIPHMEQEHFKCPHATSVFKTPQLLSVVENEIKIAEKSIMNCRCNWSVGTKTLTCTVYRDVNLLTSDMRYRYCNVLTFIVRTFNSVFVLNSRSFSVTAL